MKHDRMTTLYAVLLLVIFGGVVVHAPLSVGLGLLMPEYELLIKSWKELLLVVASIVALLVVWRRGLWRELVRDRIVQLVALYVAIHTLMAAALMTGLLPTLAGLAIDLRYILFFALVYVLLRAAPDYRRRFLQVFAAGAAVVVGFGIAQLFLPADILSHIGYGESTIQPYLTVDKNHDYIRINSTLRGPNPLGAYVVIVLGVLGAYIVRRKQLLNWSKQTAYVGLAVLASLIALWITYSRSALGGAGIALFLVAVVALRRFISRTVWIAASMIFFALIGGLIVGRDHPFVTNVLLHENREGGSPTSSNDGHVESLIDGGDRMLRQPIGGGIGSTGSASLMSDSPLIIENQYLFIAHEVGWLGLGIFLWLYGLILVRLWKQRADWLSLGIFASGIGLACIGVLLPVFVDDTVGIVWWGLAAIALNQGGSNVRTRKKTK